MTRRKLSLRNTTRSEVLLRSKCNSAMELGIISRRSEVDTPQKWSIIRSKLSLKDKDKVSHRCLLRDRYRSEIVDTQSQISLREVKSEVGANQQEEPFKGD
ncbi:StAR-related lipid transfer protein [Dirofilaria immitis]|nr:hypothetical protein [Dirofilaria immitis]